MMPNGSQRNSQLKAPQAAPRVARPRNPARRQPAACPLRTAPAARHLPLRTVPAALWYRPSLTSGPPVTLPDPVGTSARPARPALPGRGVQPASGAPRKALIPTSLTRTSR